MTQSIGPPSLAQGTRIAVGFSTSISRFIPACGELLAAPIFVRACAGSSPLARGTLYRQTAQPLGGRFIPAYAGNSILDIVYLPNHSVHPRLRGELAGNTFVENLITWFIPAYAGNSMIRDAADIAPSVHPRLRGELGSKERQSPRPGGSSPLTRGTLTRFLISATTLPVHPRLRGELTSSPVRRWDRFGSSPLTRGTRTNPHHLFHHCRFIPAYAGNSDEKILRFRVCAVHPRLRGELQPSFARRTGNGGSSPLTRGTREINLKG